jgi:hypothetical protein
MDDRGKEKAQGAVQKKKDLIVMVFTGGRTGMQNHGNPGYLNEPPPPRLTVTWPFDSGKGPICVTDRVMDGCRGRGPRRGPRSTSLQWTEAKGYILI